MKTPKKQIPEHWKESNWEEKARENPLYAIMTTPKMADADSVNFSDNHMEQLFAKGRKLYKQHVEPLLRLSDFPEEEFFLVEFGCGAGRILNAVIEQGYQCAGIDISATMLNHCKAMVPGVSSLHVCAPDTSATDLESEIATHVYSYAVLQHIRSFKVFQGAVAEMIRILKPGGILALQVNCEDFTHDGFDRPGSTENFETYSLHYKPGQQKPYRRHEQNYWSGVYIGYDTLQNQFASAGLDVIDKYYHNPKKLRATWVIGRKRTSF